MTAPIVLAALGAWAAVAVLRNAFHPAWDYVPRHGLGGAA